jgi:hypothetical protein
MHPIAVAESRISHGCRSIPCAAGERNAISEIARVNDPRNPNLAEIANAFDALRLLLRLGQRRQQHRRENGDDGDDHQQLNQRKSLGRFNFNGSRYFPIELAKFIKTLLKAAAVQTAAALIPIPKNGQG